VEGAGRAVAGGCGLRELASSKKGLNGLGGEFALFSKAQRRMRFRWVDFASLQAWL
jgi:hypothetical protein